MTTTVPHSPQHILVVLDSNGRSEHILQRLRPIAQESHATLHLLIAHPPVHTVLLQGRVVSDSAVMEGRTLQRAMAYLERLAEELHKDAIPTTIQVRFGEPVQIILDAAEACGAEVIGMTTPWIAGDGLLGPEHVTGEVIRQATASVLAARHNE